MSSELRTDSLTRPAGPSDGYLLIAHSSPVFGRGVGWDRWAEDHFARYHGWTVDRIAQEIACGGDDHLEEHASFDYGDGPPPLVPHVHFDGPGLEYAITQSDLPREMRSALLSIVRCVDRDERTEREAPGACLP